VPVPKGHIVLPKSERSTPPGTRVGPVDPNERVEVTVRLRSRSGKGVSFETMGAKLPRDRQYLTREKFKNLHGADPGDVDKIRDFARQNNLTVGAIDLVRRSVTLAGTASAFSNALGVDLARYKHGDRSFRGRTGSIYLPAELVPIVEGIFGLDDRPQARPHFRRGAAIRGSTVEGTVPRVPQGGYTPPQLASLYNFPTGANGNGQCIGIIELGGGYNAGDLSAYFTALGIDPVPNVVAVSVDGGTNTPDPNNPDSADGEVDLDIEVAGAVAPGAGIVVYFAPNTDRGFLDAITTAIHDSTNNPSVISISWGSAESQWTAQAMQTFDQAFQEASTLGVTVCCAAGDDGSSDGVQDGHDHVDFPASSPFALACGGTQLTSQGTAIVNEVVWNDPGDGATGGGISEQFDLPTWQQNASVPSSKNPGHFVGRGVPDVAGDASPITGYSVLVDGNWGVIGGTSAVAPLWAGLIALINSQRSSPVGYLNPLLYGPFAGRVCRDITDGSNGDYSAGTGWDACTGWGSPNGVNLTTNLGA
jgi:kumamolisin